MKMLFLNMKANASVYLNPKNVENKNIKVKVYKSEEEKIEVDSNKHASQISIFMMKVT